MAFRGRHGRISDINLTEPSYADREAALPSLPDVDPLRDSRRAREDCIRSLGLDADILSREVNRISTPWLRFPVDLAAVQKGPNGQPTRPSTTVRTSMSPIGATNTILRCVRTTTLSRWPCHSRRQPLDNARVNGITTSIDGTTIYVTLTGPNGGQGGVLALPAF